MLDYIALTLWIILFIGEVVADQQQWNFQTNKYELLRKNNNQK
jgi:steroid 5-alpha reductase family enzyme